MQVTFLGTGAALPGPDGACSGRIVRAGGQNILVDCGHGVAGKLQGTGDTFRLSAIVLSHLHADHCIDIVALYWGRRISKIPGRVPLLLPETQIPRLHTILNAFQIPSEQIGEVFELTEVGPNRPVTLGGARLTFAHGDHTVPTVGIRIQEPGASFAFTGDAASIEPLVDLMRGVDLLLSEATVDADLYAQGNKVHLTPPMAAELALRAGARRLVLTHLWPTHDSAKLLAQARAVFPQTELAREGTTVPVP